VSTDEGEAKAKEHGVLFIETSAKAGFNVKVSASFSSLKFPFTSTSTNIKHLTEYCCHGNLNPAGAVPHDRDVLAWNGSSLVGEAGRHGGYQPAACLRTSRFKSGCRAGAESRRVCLLRLPCSSAKPLTRIAVAHWG
jgi:hypothetical protein